MWYAALSKTEWPKDTETLENLRQSWDEIYGDRGHELVFIAQNLEKEKTIKKLSKCLLTDEEDRGGVPIWQNFKDPLPLW